jgi:hypothetical protein
MRYVKAEPASSDVHIWSPTGASVNAGYHKILGTVKGSSEFVLWLRA